MPAPPSPTPAPRIVDAVAGLAVAALAAGVIAEATVRLVHPTLDAPIVDTRTRAVTWVEEHPLWAADDTAARQNPACAEGAVEVALVGSSVTYGAEVARADTVAARLAVRLGPAWCVRNFGQPGYTGAQKRLAAEQAIAAHHPAIVLYEVRRDDDLEYVRVGTSAVAIDGSHIDADGGPAAPIPLPTSLHRLLLERSAAWRYAVIALASQGDAASWAVRVPGHLQRVQDALGADGKLAVWVASRLDQPFADQARDNPTSSDVGHVFTWGKDHDVPVLDPAAAWGELDPATLGVDAVCHLNRTGADALAALLEPEVRRLTAQVVRPPTPGPVDPLVLAHAREVAARLPKLAAARERCAALVLPVRPDQVWDAPPPWDLATLDAACRELGGAYDELAPILGGVMRTTDVLLTHVARASDDLDYARRTIDVKGHERTNALQHVHDALGWLTAAERAWVMHAHQPYDTHTATTPSGWTQGLREDTESAAQLRDALDRLGLDGTDPELVRGRMLDGFVRVPTRSLAGRRAALLRTPDDATRQARTAYLDAWATWIAAATHAIDAARAGELDTEPALAAEVAALDAATVTWKAAHAAAPP